MRARRSERVRRLSCSIALSILGAPSALPQPRRRPLRLAPYIPPRPVLRPEALARPSRCPGLHGPLGASSSVPVLGVAEPITEGTPATTVAGALPAAATASLLDSHGLLGTVVPSRPISANWAEPRYVLGWIHALATQKPG